MHYSLGKNLGSSQVLAEMICMIIKQLDKEDLARISEIDRSEHVTLGYVYEDGKLRTRAGDWHIRRWTTDDSGYSVGAKIKEWSPLLDQNGVLLGAFKKELLVGFAILRLHLTETVAQLAVLHVSKEHRRQGIARALTTQISQMAKESGATSFYVSSAPTESAVGFYQSQGFELASKVHPELYALEPEDIHMIKTL